MKKLLRSESLRVLFAIAVALGLAEFTVAADKKDARVTQVIKDVRVLATKTGARPASVNDTVREGQAVRTGTDSRAELTFTDQTLTRLGSNTVFSFREGAKDFELSGGAVLICVPKSAGTVKINTAAATAAVTGFTALVEAHATALNKWYILEGEACVKKKHKKNIPVDPCITLHAGDMLVFLPGGQLGPIRQFDIKKTLHTAGLINGFDNKLPDWALNEILAAGDAQQSGPPPAGGYSDPTGGDDISQKNATPKPMPTQMGSPSGLRSHRQPGRP
jgi:hypothetical protein